MNDEREAIRKSINNKNEYYNMKSSNNKSEDVIRWERIIKEFVSIKSDLFEEVELFEPQLCGDLKAMVCLSEAISMKSFQSVINYFPSGVELIQIEELITPNRTYIKIPKNCLKKKYFITNYSKYLILDFFIISFLIYLLLSLIYQKDIINLYFN
jgi:hypothetical protein